MGLPIRRHGLGAIQWEHLLDTGDKVDHLHWSGPSCYLVI